MDEPQDTADPPPSSEEGVEAFAQIIDAVLRLEFIDEQLEACQQMGSDARPITTQPHSLYTVPDLNKLLHLRGVRLYTDLFSRPELTPGVERLPGAESVVFTSMYLRRQQAANRNLSDSQESGNAFYSCYSNGGGEKSLASPRLAEELGISFAESVAPSTSSENGKRRLTSESDESFVPSNPVQFARFVGEKQTVRLRLRNTQISDSSGLNKKLDVEMFLGGLSMILSPTQVYLLVEVLDTILEQGNWSGEEKFYDTSRRPVAKKSDGPVSFGSGNNFESISVNEVPSEANSASPDLLQPLNIKTAQSHSSSKSPKSPGLTERPEVTHCKMKLNNLWVTLTHKDPLGSEAKIKSAVEKLQSLAETFFEQSKAVSLSNRSDLTDLRKKMDLAYQGDHLRLVGCPAVFDCTLERCGGVENVIVQFSTANCEILECLTSDSVISDDSGNQQNVRSTASSATVGTTSITSENGGMTSSAGENGNERHLAAESEAAAMIYVELAKFGDEYANEEAESVIGDESEAGDDFVGGVSENDAVLAGNYGEEPSLRMMITNRGRKEHYAISLELMPCFTELDLSLMDRLYNLANCYPVFRKGGQAPSWRSGEEALLQMQRKRDRERGSDLSLSEDLFAPLSEKNRDIGHISTALSSGNSAESPKTIFDIDIRCSHWTVDVRIPIADLRDAAAHDRPPWWVRRVRPESLRLKLQGARLACAGLSDSSARIGEFKLTCQEATGYFLTPTPELNGLEKFLYATGLEGVSHCSMTFKWDFLNKSLCVDGGLASTEDNSMNSWGSYFRVPKSADGPFSKDRVLHENEELTLVGNRQEMQEFSGKCLSYSELAILLDLPQVRVVLPGKEFYELLYNRLVNDLAMWEPSSPAYQTRPAAPPGGDFGAGFTGASQYYSVHVAGLSDQRFGMCKSMAKHTESDEESGDESDGTTLDRSSITGTPSGKRGRKSANRLCFRLRADQGKVLMSLPNVENENSEGELSLAARKGEIFVVSGYQGDPNLVYFYVTLNQAWLWHQNVNETTVKYSKNVSGRGFGRCDETGSSLDGTMATDLCAEPTPEGLDLTAVKEDNFAVAMRLELKPKENLKEMLIAIGIRNTTVHYQPFTTTADWWLIQLVEFFNVPDYPIAGYSMPRTLAELHVHAWSSCVAYRSAESSKKSAAGSENAKRNSVVGLREPMLLRIWVEAADISSYIVQDATALKLNCIFENTKLYLGDKEAGNLKRDFVCLMSMGIFELVVTVIDETAMNEEEREKSTKNRRTPMLEVRAKNDKVTVWTCADSLAALGRVVERIAEESLSDAKQLPAERTNYETPSETMENEKREAVEAKDEAPEPKQKGDLTLSDEEELKETMEDAMEDLGPISTGKKSSTGGVSTDSAADFRRDLERKIVQENAKKTKPRSQNSSTGTDEDFCMVDEIPGSGIQSVSGEPRVRCLLDGESVVTKENHFAAPSRRTDPLTCLPPGYPQPIIRYLIKDITLVVNLFSGADFCDTAPVRPYSQTSVVNTGGVGANAARKAIYARQQQLRDQDCKGGPHRDHSVQVEIQLSKICFLYELFGPDAPAVSRQLLLVQDVEIRDKLALSQINKVLYQYWTDKKPRQTQAPMLAVRMLETALGEGKLKLSLLPLRLNIDQDTLEFLQDFGTELSDRLKQNGSKRTRASSSTSSSDSGPILEVPSRRAKDASHSATTALGSESETPSQMSSVINSFSAPPELSDLDICLDRSPILTESVATLGDIFGENEADLAPPGTSENSSTKSSTNLAESDDGENLTENIARELDQILLTTETSAMAAQPLGTVKFTRMTSSQNTVTSSQSSSTKTTKSDGERKSGEKGTETQILPLTQGPGGLYFTEFTFSPSVSLRLDYQGKQRFDMTQGTLQGLLIGLSQLHCTELCLKDLHHRQGLLGVERVAQFAVNEWVNDIRKYQIPQVVGSVGPISSLTQIGQGIRDLIWMPVEEYKKDGHLVKGIQKGAGSFGVSTSSAAIELAQRLVGAVQGMAEFAFDIVSPEYPPPRQGGHDLVSLRQPVDFREGLGMAYDDLRLGMSETARVLQLAAQEERASGRWPLRGILRQATPTVLRPVVVASKATGHFLGGLRSQLKPESRQEELDKWRGTEK